MLNVILYVFSVLRVFELIIRGHNSCVLLECGRKLDYELTGSEQLPVTAHTHSLAGLSARWHLKGSSKSAMLL